MVEIPQKKPVVPEQPVVTELHVVSEITVNPELPLDTEITMDTEITLGTENFPAHGLSGHGNEHFDDSLRGSQAIYHPQEFKVKRFSCSATIQHSKN